MRLITQRPRGGPYSDAALIPPLPLAAGRALWWGASGVVGHPGTARIHAPAPGVAGGDRGEAGMPSHSSPNVILPSLYWQVPNAYTRPRVRIRSNTPLPVPAGNMYNMAGVSMVSRRTGGNTQVTQPGVVQRWPDLLKSRRARRGGSA